MNIESTSLLPLLCISLSLPLPLWCFGRLLGGITGIMSDVWSELRAAAGAVDAAEDSVAFAAALDAADPLKEFRSRFHIPKVGRITKDSARADAEEDCIYLCGNSLGLQPKTTRAEIMQELDDWAALGVEGHWEARRPWVSTDDEPTALMAEVVGAKTAEVAIMNSLSVNMHLMLVSFYRPTKERYKILMEGGAFPSDRYGVESHVKLHGYTKEEAVIEMVPRAGEQTLREEDILEMIEKEGDSIAVVFFSGIQYYTGQLFPMQSITEAGHRKGCYVGFDLAHAVGNARVFLHDWNVDFAVWCGYKYLNSSPGTIAGLFVHGSLCGVFQQSEETVMPANHLLRLQGWWGNTEESRFAMDQPFNPIPGAYGFRLSNPPVLCVSALLCSLRVFHDAGMDRLRAKSLLLTGYLEALLLKLIPESAGLKVITPSDRQARGCQLSLLFTNQGMAQVIFRKLQEGGVVADVRKPDVIRIAPTPLYNTFQDVWRFVHILEEVVKSY